MNDAKCDLTVKDCQYYIVECHMPITTVDYPVPDPGPSSYRNNEDTREAFDSSYETHGKVVAAGAISVRCFETLCMMYAAESPTIPGRQSACLGDGQTDRQTFFEACDARRPVSGPRA